MTDISYEILTGKLTPLAHEAFRKAFWQAREAGNQHVELAHFLFQLVSAEGSDVALSLDHFGVSAGAVLAELADAIGRGKRNVTEMPSVGAALGESLDRGWLYASLLFGSPAIRSGHVLVGALRDEALQKTLAAASRSLAGIDAGRLADAARTVWGGSPEETQRPVDGSSLPEVSGGRAPASGLSPEDTSRSPLARFATDLTAEAASGRMDPVVGRDHEIRQIVDVLSRRRQNNPLLTGEAGVGKTAVVEGFAQRIAAGDVPPSLRKVKLHALDVGLMQAGASVKGEFEQRLRALVDEVQASPEPIILFIDEVHTLVGAGGAKGTGDAANLLKPALARGTLRTIGATTFAEYRTHIESDPALTRRFQPIPIGEPDIARAAIMLRGLALPMERHHGVRILDEAVTAAVSLSARYIPARQLPDKAVSLLDTAAARVAISQTTVPARIADLAAAIDALAAEGRALEREAALTGETGERRSEIAAEIAEKTARRTALLAAHEEEAALVKTIVALAGPERAAKPRAGGATDGEAPVVEGTAADGDAVSPAPPPEQDGTRDELAHSLAALAAIDPDRRMIHAHVDADAVASVVSDWTGIPVGRMLRDEIATVLGLAGLLKKRVVGQDHGLETIARRILTSRAGLDDPGKPVGVFLLCGPSGVGKTETALALAETLYGGEENLVTINMSEFQEAHTVSALKGAPPGYVGYGEGGRLTEAVRRRPYSVVLLDEVEKAHPDVHELFFQVFDKGWMEDGTGRRIDFRNTLIILTSNVGTEAIMAASGEGLRDIAVEELDRLLRPELLDVFPPALIGRMVTVPYRPLSAEMLEAIVRLQLARIVERVKESQRAALRIDDAVVAEIVGRCRDPQSGGRMIDRIVTQTLLPELSRKFLEAMVSGDVATTAHVGLGEDGAFVVAVE
ncbi:type VI secretion system ATPase TssH [Aurantimonas sp. 22II-16-19i]|uniref:type VI secretion system ATPase TssH n=1 Tax=Aurantimonas sp. 22II-16-19i TaxID=1317114 RepID=UPI0009F7B9C9|nr:type VI secretion system ATPase TssH [Aurantimonas sp. 22II-16-19i]ORE92844.1 ATP-dependent Clp protease, ATP-binding subunit [Aurantimonas sp. 22II-16-19i]